MSQFFKNKKQFIIALSALFLVVTLVAGSFAFLAGDSLTTANILEDGESSEEELSQDEIWDTQFPDDSVVDPITPVNFNVPEEMRGTYLIPGVDFMAEGSDLSAQTVQQEIDAAFDAIRGTDSNAVIIGTDYNDLVIYDTKDAATISAGMDIMDYVVEKARTENLYTYAIFDAAPYVSKQQMGLLALGAGTSDKLSSNLSEFAEKYQLDGILIDGYGYETSKDQDSYASYLELGGGMGFDNFRLQSPAAVIKTASKAVRNSAPSTQLGMLADVDTALDMDARIFVEDGLVDFVSLKAESEEEREEDDFRQAAYDWSGVAKENGIQMYVVNTGAKLFTGESGWTPEVLDGEESDEPVQNISTGSTGTKRPTSSGSATSSRPAEAEAGSDEPDGDSGSGSQGTVYAKTEEIVDQVISDLEMTKPAKTSFTTTDNVVTFAGASDPDEEVTIDGQAIDTDANGYFSVQKDLKAGSNKFVIAHKGKSVSYSITRKAQLLDSVTPSGSVTVDGGMSLTVTVRAYQSAKVTATLDSDTITLVEDESAALDEQDKDNSFRTFKGTFTMPSATSEAQKLGSISVSASYDGETSSLKGASVTVNKKNSSSSGSSSSGSYSGDGTPVRVVADQALTYPAGTLDNVPNPSYFPLPKGALDYIEGDEITYKKSDSETFKYYVLASGLRVESKDVETTSDRASGNSISGVSVKSDSDYTYITVNSKQPVSYSVKYTSSGISYTFHNTSDTPGDMSLSKNPLFTSANWNGSTMTLSFVKSGSFMGYRGSYDGSGNLVLRFNNPPESLSSARIAIDPGHGGKDVGAVGFRADYPEKVINKAIAEYLASELESRGATVNLLDVDNINTTQRRQIAEDWGPDYLISIHCNSAPRDSATGTEVYYFHQFSSLLASNLSSAVSGAMNTDNRGGRASFYHINLSPQFQSAMVECGFMTNQGEYEKLIDSAYQKKIAAAIADGLSDSIKGTYTNVSSSGSESVGSEQSSSTDDQSSSSSSDDQSSSSSSEDESSTEDTELEAVWIRESLAINKGKYSTLVPSFYPADTEETDVTWESDDTSIATVDENGRVHGVAEGYTTIRVKTARGGLTSTCDVEVRASGESAIKVKSVELPKTELTMSVGEKYMMEATVTPDDADDNTVTWRSNRSAVVSVSETGKLTALKEGEATITATSREGNKRATCKVTVSGVTGTGSIDGSSESSSEKDSGIRLSEAEDAYIDVNEMTVYPGNPTRVEIINEIGELIRGSDFTWKSEDASIVTVDAKGYVTGKKSGEAWVTASADGYDDLEVLIVVSKDKQKVSGVSLDKSSITVVRRKTKDLTATITPSNASERTVVWSTSDKKIATVDANGTVTGVKEGTCTITVRTKEGDYTATCTVTVINSGVKLEEIYIDEEEIDLYVDETYEIEPDFDPSDATNTDVTWSSSNPEVATVDKDGKVTALKKGRTRITVVSNEKSTVRASVTVIVDD